MKNKFLSILFFLLINFNNLLFAQEFIFEASKINVLDDGNTIIAEKGSAIFPKKNLKINANRFNYNKIDLILIATSGTAKFSTENLEIKANKIYFDEKTSVLKATGNVEINNYSKDINIKSQNIIYDIPNQIINSKSSSLIKFDLGNQIKFNTFSYLMNDDLIRLNDVNIIDIENNIYSVKKAFLNVNSKKLIGKDVSINFKNLNFEKDNDPRIKSNSIIVDNNNIELNKAVFTTCKKNDDCPPWQLSAKKIKHDKKKKIIRYKNAWLKIYDVPVFYFPDFFHPDPSVKRQSGFLAPKIEDSSSLGMSINIPYFLALSKNSDVTFNPILYSNNKYLIQTEYRRLDKDTKHDIDLGYLNDVNSSKSHFFYKGSKNLNLRSFDDSNIALKIEQTSNETYLKTYDLKSPIIKSNDLLNSFINIDLYREDDLAFTADVQVYEDLTKQKSDRYEFIYPNFNLIKQIENNTELDGNFSIASSGYMKNYNTNVYEKVLVNDLIFNSNSFLTAEGLMSEYNVIIKSVGTDGKNSDKVKDVLDFSLASLFELNSSYPMIKKMTNFEHILKPKTSIRFGTNQTIDQTNEDIRSNIDNIYSLNRTVSNQIVEGGASLTYGAEFIKTDKSSVDNRDIFSFEMANVLRFKKNKELARNSRLGEKNSDIFGKLMLSPDESLKVSYDFSLKDNLRNTNYEYLTTEFKVNKFITSFEYLNENNTNSKESYLANTSSYTIDDSNSLSFGTRLNKKTRLTEFYNLIYQYKNDCLAAAIEYKKDYYSDKDLKPEENIFFKLTITPLGGFNTPNLIK